MEWLSSDIRWSVMPFEAMCESFARVNEIVAILGFSFMTLPSYDPFIHACGLGLDRS